MLSFIMATIGPKSQWTSLESAIQPADFASRVRSFFPILPLRNNTRATNPLVHSFYPIAELRIKMARKSNDLKVWMAVAACVGLCGLNTGCQVHVAGQTLPSPYYLDDDVQYFPAGPENKLANETAALKAAREEAKARR